MILQAVDEGGGLHKRVEALLTKSESLPFVARVLMHHTPNACVAVMDVSSSSISGG